MRIEDRILFIDGEAIVIDKPAGLPVDPPRDGGLSVASYLDLLRYGFARQPLPVHRIDRDTSGCLLLARNPKAHRRFASAFEDGGVEKAYLAVIEGTPTSDGGVIDLPLAKRSSREEGWRIVPDPAGKRAVTRWTSLDARNGRALLRLSPETGRTHQLRVHLASGLGMPIVGDPVYGRAGEAMLLHAAALSLPRGGKPPVAAEAPLPESFARAGFIVGVADAAG